MTTKFSLKIKNEAFNRFVQKIVKKTNRYLVRLVVAIPAGISTVALGVFMPLSALLGFSLVETSFDYSEMILLSPKELKKLKSKSGAEAYSYAFSLAKKRKIEKDFNGISRDGAKLVFEHKDSL